MTNSQSTQLTSNGNDTLENAQRRSEYWKAEHLAANREIERLRAGLERVLGTLRMYSRETAAAYDDILASEATPAHETSDQRGPYCPDTQQPCERMCQSLCNRRTGEATEHRPENIDCAICKAELPLSMIEMGGRLCPTCVGMPAQKAGEPRLATDEIRDLACCDVFVRESASEFCGTCGYTNLDHLRKRSSKGK